MEIPSLQFITHEKIDKVKWDQCIAQAHNGRVYAYSEYLDAMAGSWDALVLANYQWVMPVISNKKCGYTYIYQPAFTANLGIFGNHITTSIESLFIQYLHQHFNWIEMDLNSGNRFTLDAPYFITRKNYVLSLNNSYETLAKNYRPFIRKKINAAKQGGLTIDHNVDFPSMMNIVLAHPFHKKTISKKNQSNFQQLYQTFYQKKKAYILGVRNPQNQLLSIAVFLFSNNRYYYILAASTSVGKKTGASHFLIDQFIQLHANENNLLDFEGSDKEALAFFYNSFGAVLETFPAIRKNELGWGVKLLKKIKQFIQS